MMPTISLTALSAVLQKVVCQSLYRHSNAYDSIIIILLHNGLITIIFIIIRLYLLTNFITMLMIDHSNATTPFQLPYTNAHAQLNSTWLD